MRFWYMQLHPGSGRGSQEDRDNRKSFSADKMCKMLLRYKMIGMGNEEQWGEDNDRGQIKSFKDKMNIGDVVMCGEGSKFFALVRVVSEWREGIDDRQSEDDQRWFELYRHVEVLNCDAERFEHLYDSQHPEEAEPGRKPHYSHCNIRQTLSEWKKNTFIQFWYEQLGVTSNEIDSFSEELKVLPETEIIALSPQRRGQDRIRKALLKYRQRCEACGLEIPELLRASHIKPWKDASNAERLDLHNVLLLSANYDAVFDSGFITFSAEDGRLVKASSISNEQLQALGINPDASIAVPSKERAEYLEWHKNNVFRG